MILRIPTPRWLPATIGVLAGLLAVKSVTLVRAVISPGPTADLSLLSGQARAAGPTQAPKPDAKPANSKPADPKTANSGAAGAKPIEPRPEDGAAANQAPAEPPITGAERAILMELRQRRQELDQRAAALSEKEAVMGAAQDKLQARIEELRGLQQKLEGLDAERRRQEDASWQGLVKLYETMKPREAATIFNDLAMPILVQVMDRMKDAKAAAILAAMEPEKARLLTQSLARLRTHAELEPPPPPRPPAQPTAAPTRPPPPPAPRPRQPNG